MNHRLLSAPPPPPRADVPAGDLHQRAVRGRAAAGVPAARRRHQPGLLLRVVGGRPPANLPRGRGLRGGGGPGLLAAQVFMYVVLDACCECRWSSTVHAVVYPVVSSIRMYVCVQKLSDFEDGPWGSENEAVTGRRRKKPAVEITKTQERFDIYVRTF